MSEEERFASFAAAMSSRFAARMASLFAARPSLIAWRATERCSSERVFRSAEAVRACCAISSAMVLCVMW